MKKETNQHIDTVIPEAFDFTFDANISPITVHGRGPQPTQYVAIKTTNDKMGRNLILSTFAPLERR